MPTSRNDVLEKSAFGTTADWSMSHGRRFRANIMKSTKAQTLGVIYIQLYSSIIKKFTPIGSSNVDRHIDRVSVAA